ncbi:MAG: NUDIX domain-containing protein [Bacteroidia bacterium]|nr:NUDIX domain-containing protein [Bacteroidia bacterium]
MYNVYINERLLRFVGVHDPVGGAEMVLKLKGDEPAAHMRVLVDTFEQSVHTESLILQSLHLDKSWKTFTSLYTLMEAAGGLVVNQHQQLLMIYRNGKWDLPKGKIEHAEEPDTAAIREVFEECGVGYLKLQKQVQTTFHTYPFKDHKVLKKTYWFLMSTVDESDPIPQLEEGITEAKWVNRSELKSAMRNSYASIVNLLKEQVLEHEPGLLG